MVKMNKIDRNEERKNPTNAEVPIVLTMSAKKHTSIISVGRSVDGLQCPRYSTDCVILIDMIHMNYKQK